MNTTNNFGREIVTPIEFEPNRCIFQLIEINRGKHYKVAVIDTGGKLQNKLLTVYWMRNSVGSYSRPKMKR